MGEGARARGNSALDRRFQRCERICVCPLSLQKCLGLPDEDSLDTRSMGEGARARGNSALDRRF
jgi:hypothetical protein